MPAESAESKRQLAAFAEPTPVIRLDELLAAGVSTAAEPSAAGARQAGRQRCGAVIGTVVGIDEGGRPLVDFPGNSAAQPLPACSTVVLSETALARQVAIVFEAGDPGKPIVLGLLQEPQPTAAGAASEPTTEKPQQPTAAEKGPPLVAQLDGQRVVLNAGQEIVLQCGQASITLTRAGKVLIRGAYLLSRSSGVNRIKGGSVQIN
jgi:hypothetical protein